MFNINLANKVALVTGSSRGIGRMCALYLAEAGCNVVVNYANDRAAGERTVAEIEAFGVKAHLVQCDVSDSKAVEAMVAEGIAVFGKVDILVNNAGVGVGKGAEETTDEILDRVFGVNVRAYAAACRAVLPSMKTLGWGRIVCISSVVGRSGKAFIGTSPAYAGAKGAVLSYSRAMAREFGGTGITVNCVCPGWIDYPGKNRVVTPELRASAIAQMPVGRVGDDRDVAGAVLYLSSPLADYVTGVSLDVNGGLYMA
ncbi:MAG TPA: 3-oxoacyl-ACP reductase family protein [Devosiaceae bacterium]|jgi:3-oxoacyl-[acyl-carrier protein] reductase